MTDPHVKLSLGYVSFGGQISTKINRHSKERGAFFHQVLSYTCNSGALNQHAVPIGPIRHRIYFRDDKGAYKLGRKYDAVAIRYILAPGFSICPRIQEDGESPGFLPEI